MCNGPKQESKSEPTSQQRGATSLEETKSDLRTQQGDTTPRGTWVPSHIVSCVGGHPAVHV